MDEIDGVKSAAVPQILTAGTVSGSERARSAARGWPNLAARYPPAPRRSTRAAPTTPMDALTMAQYADIPLKTTVGLARCTRTTAMRPFTLPGAERSDNSRCARAPTSPIFCRSDTDYGMPKA